MDSQSNSACSKPLVSLSPALSSPRNELIKMVKLLAESKKVINDLIRERVHLTNELSGMKMNLDKTKEDMQIKEQKLFEEKKARETHLLKELKLKESKLAHEIKWRERLMLEQMKKIRKETKCTETDENFWKTTRQTSSMHLSDNFENKSTQWVLEETTDNDLNYLLNSSNNNIEGGVGQNVVEECNYTPDLELVNYAANDAAIQVDFHSSPLMFGNYFKTDTYISEIPFDNKLLKVGSELSNHSRTNKKMKRKKGKISKFEKVTKTRELARKLNSVIYALKNSKKKRKKENADKLAKANVRIELLESYLKELSVLKLKHQQQSEELKQQQFFFGKLLKNVRTDESQWQLFEEKVNKLDTYNLFLGKAGLNEHLIINNTNIGDSSNLDSIHIPQNGGTKLDSNDKPDNQNFTSDEVTNNSVHAREKLKKLREHHIQLLKNASFMINEKQHFPITRLKSVESENDGVLDNKNKNNNEFKNAKNSRLSSIAFSELDEKNIDANCNLKKKDHYSHEDELVTRKNNIYGEEKICNGNNSVNYDTFQFYLQKIHEHNLQLLKSKREDRFDYEKNELLIKKINKLLNPSNKNSYNTKTDNENINNNNNVNEIDETSFKSISSSMSFNNDEQLLDEKVRDKSRFQKFQNEHLGSLKEFRGVCSQTKFKNMDKNIDVVNNIATPLFSASFTSVTRSINSEELLGNGKGSAKNQHEIGASTPKMKNCDRPRSQFTDCDKCFNDLGCFGKGSKNHSLIQYIPLHRYHAIGSTRKQKNFCYSVLGKNNSNKKCLNSDNAKQVSNVKALNRNKKDRGVKYLSSSSIVTICSESVSVETDISTAKSNSLNENELIQKEAIENFLIENVKLEQKTLEKEIEEHEKLLKIEKEKLLKFIEMSEINKRKVASEVCQKLNDIESYYLSQLDGNNVINNFQTVYCGDYERKVNSGTFTDREESESNVLISNNNNMTASSNPGAADKLNNSCSKSKSLNNNRCEKTTRNANRRLMKSVDIDDRNQLNVSDINFKNGSCTKLNIAKYCNHSDNRNNNNNTDDDTNSDGVDFRENKGTDLVTCCAHGLQKMLHDPTLSKKTWSAASNCDSNSVYNYAAVTNNNNNNNNPMDEFYDSFSLNKNNTNNNTIYDEYSSNKKVKNRTFRRVDYVNKKLKTNQSNEDAKSNLKSNSDSFSKSRHSSSISLSPDSSVTKAVKDERKTRKKDSKTEASLAWKHLLSKLAHLNLKPRKSRRSGNLKRQDQSFEDEQRKTKTETPQRDQIQFDEVKMSGPRDILNVHASHPSLFSSFRQHLAPQPTFQQQKQKHFQKASTDHYEFHPRHSTFSKLVASNYQLNSRGQHQHLLKHPPHSAEININAGGDAIVTSFDPTKRFGEATSALCDADLAAILQIGSINKCKQIKKKNSSFSVLEKI